MAQKRYTKEVLEQVCKTCLSRREVLLKLNIIAEGGNYQTLNKYIKKFSIDITHFKGRKWNLGRTFSPKRHIEEYLSNKFPIHSNKLRLKLIKLNIFKHQCMQCKRTRWNKLPIPLELEHKDGNHFNNELKNLALLCPNCHAQTSTYRGKNIKNPLSSALPF